jgi:hypothetical protein
MAFKSEEEIKRFYAEYSLKLYEDIPQNNPPIEEDERIVCQIRVRGRNNATGWNQVLGSLNVKIKALSLTEWTQFTISYSIENLPPEAYAEYRPTRKFGNNENTREFVKQIDFEVYWFKVEGYQLAVDNVLCYDTRGDNFLVSKIELQNIKDQIENTSQIYHFPPNDFDKVIVGWYAIDEPETIDNMEPIRVIDSLITELSKNMQNKMKLFVAFAGNWLKTFGGPGLEPANVDRYREFYKRSKINGSILNDYHFKTAGQDDEDRLWRLIENNLQQVNKYDKDFIFSVQNGK